MGPVNRHPSRTVLGIGLLLLLLEPLAGMADVRLGILAFRPKAEVEQQWQPLVDYLEKSLDGDDVTLAVMNYPELEAAIAGNQVDFVLTNPSHYVQMTFRNGLSSPLATLIPIERGIPVDGFGGVIFTRGEETGINRLEDLRGHKVAAVFKGSLGGYQAQAMELLRAGVRIPQNVRLIETGMPHDAVVQAVLAGRADAGFVRTGVLEAMVAEGSLDLARLRLLNGRAQPGFPFLLSTPLYPEWPLAAASKTDHDLARRVAAAMLSLPHYGDVARRIGIKGFCIPEDYESVRLLLQALRLPPYDATPNFTMGDVLKKYKAPLQMTAVMSVVILLLVVRLLVLNKRLGQERQRVERQSEERRRLLAAMGDGVYGVDQQGRCTFINPAALKMLQYAHDEIVGLDQHSLFHALRENGAAYPTQECPITLTLSDGETRHLEEWFIRKDGKGFPVLLTVTPVESHGVREGGVVVFSDISERRRLETELRTQASTDALTGLANRRHFLSELERELSRVQRHPAQPAAILMVDLDRFKRINDRYGHAIGDLVLRSFAELLQSLSRKSDKAGRLGGEEFCLLLPNSSMEQACQMASRLCASAAAMGIPTAQGELHYTVSVGVTMLEGTDPSVDGALARADAALYQAKDAGRNCIVCDGADAEV